MCWWAVPLAGQLLEVSAGDAYGSGPAFSAADSRDISLAAPVSADYAAASLTFKHTFGALLVGSK